MILPPALNPGDKIAIIAPATIVKREYVEGAHRLLAKQGFDVSVMPHTLGPAYGSFASTEEDRTADLAAAWTDPQVKAVLCARGGYGCVHLLPTFSRLLRENPPRWLIGFSDISALHAATIHAGICSLHAPMAKHFAMLGPEDPCTKMELDILRGQVTQTITSTPHPLNRFGTAQGSLQGGNLAVLNGLADTPYDILHTDPHEKKILFIEDVSEKIYAVERMLTRLLLGGSLHHISALLVGQFTEYTADRNHPDMETMIDRLLTRHNLDIPVVYGFPTGHTDINYPLIEGAQASLRVTAHGASLTMNPTL